MKDFAGAIEAGYTNEDLNGKMGTTGIDYAGAVSAGYSNEELQDGVNAKFGKENPRDTRFTSVTLDGKTIRETESPEVVKKVDQLIPRGGDVGITQNQLDNLFSKEQIAKDMDTALNFVTPVAAAATGIKGLFNLGKGHVSRLAKKGESEFGRAKSAAGLNNQAKYGPHAQSADEVDDVLKRSYEIAGPAQMKVKASEIGSDTAMQGILDMLPNNKFTNYLKSFANKATATISTKSALKHKAEFINKAKEAGLSEKSADDMYNYVMRSSKSDVVSDSVNVIGSTGLMINAMDNKAKKESATKRLFEKTGADAGITQSSIDELTGNGGIESAMNLALDFTPMGASTKIVDLTARQIKGLLAKGIDANHIARLTDRPVQEIKNMSTTGAASKFGSAKTEVLPESALYDRSIHKMSDDTADEIADITKREQSSNEWLAGVKSTTNPVAAKAASYAKLVSAGFSASEIADITGKNIAAVRKQIQRSRDYIEAYSTSGKMTQTEIDTAVDTINGRVKDIDLVNANRRRKRYLDQGRKSGLTGTENIDKLFNFAENAEKKYQRSIKKANQDNK